MNNTQLKLNILENARKLITDKNHWTPFYLAITELGVVTTPSAAIACKFCAFGAISRFLTASKARINLGVDIQIDLTNKIKKLYPACASIFSVNDNPAYGHKAVLQVFDSLIEDYKNLI